MEIWQKDVNVCMLSTDMHKWSPCKAGGRLKFPARACVLLALLGSFCLHASRNWNSAPGATAHLEQLIFLLLSWLFVISLIRRATQCYCTAMSRQSSSLFVPRPISRNLVSSHFISWDPISIQQSLALNDIIFSLLL